MECDDPIATCRVCERLGCSTLGDCEGGTVDSDPGMTNATDGVAR